jgi:hypothetical protein
MPRHLLTLVALVGLALPAGAMAAPRMEIGIHDDDVFVDHAAIPLADPWAALRPLRVGVLRTLVTERDVTANGWDRVSSAVDAARAHGLQVEVALVGRFPRADLAGYARFAGEAAARLRGRVDRYEIWNEPNLRAWLAAPSPRATAALYRRLFIAGSKAIKASDPAARVLIGVTAPFVGRSPGQPPLAFLRRVLCVDRHYRAKRCPGLVADGYAHNPFDLDHRPSYRFPGRDNATIGTLRRLTTALNRLARLGALRTPRGARLDVYLTEFGYISRGPHGISQATRARWLPEAFAIAARNPRVREAIQYLLINPPPPDPFATGLIEADGTVDPAYRTLSAWATRHSR